MEMNFQELFENIEERTDIGIGLETLTPQILNTTVCDLINDEETIERLLKYRSAFHITLYKKLGELNRGELYDYLAEHVLLEYMVPLISRYIALYPLMPGAYFYGEFLIILFRMDKAFWTEHESWYLYFKDIAKKALDSEEGEKLDRRVAFELMKSVNKSSL